MANTVVLVRLQARSRESDYSAVRIRGDMEREESACVCLPLQPTSGNSSKFSAVCSHRQCVDNDAKVEDLARPVNPRCLRITAFKGKGHQLVPSRLRNGVAGPLERLPDALRLADAANR